MTVVLNTAEDFNLETLERVALKGEPAAFGTEGLAAMSAAASAGP